MRQYVTDLDRATKGAITSYEAIGPQWGAGLAQPEAVHYRDGFELIIANCRAVTVTVDVHFAADGITASAWAAEYVRGRESDDDEGEGDDEDEDEADEEVVASAGPLAADNDAAGSTIIGEVVAGVLIGMPYFAEFGVPG